MGSLANDKGPAGGIEPLVLRHAGSLLIKLWRKYQINLKGLIIINK